MHARRPRPMHHPRPLHRRTGAVQPDRHGPRRVRPDRGAPIPAAARRSGLRVVGLAETRQAGHTQWMVRLTTTPSTAQTLAHSLARRPDTWWVKLVSGGTEIFTLIHAPHGVEVSRALFAARHPAPSGDHRRLRPLRAAHLSRAAPPPGAESPRPSATASNGSCGLQGIRRRAAPSSYGRRCSSGTRGSGTIQPPTRPRTARPAPPARADRELLAALRQDGRASYADLATATGLVAGHRRPPHRRPARPRHGLLRRGDRPCRPRSHHAGPAVDGRRTGPPGPRRDRARRPPRTGRRRRHHRPHQPPRPGALLRPDRVAPLPRAAPRRPRRNPHPRDRPDPPHRQGGRHAQPGGSRLGLSSAS